MTRGGNGDRMSHVYDAKARSVSRAGTIHQMTHLASPHRRATSAVRRSVWRRALLPLACLASLAACGGSPPTPSPDGGPRPDAGGGGADAGIAAGTDAGPPADGGGQADASRAADGGEGLVCPPSGPTGSAVGEIAPDLRLMDCDGVEHSLHDLCDRQALWLFEFADWCPPCRTFASSRMNPIYASHASESFEGWMVISADAGFGRPDAADCAEIRSRYGVTMPVLFDPTGAFQTAFGVAANEINIVLSEGARIEWVGHYASSEVDSRITEVLAR